MAKLCVAYGLCPLIDQRSLLGVSEDSVPGHVIVTMGKNIAIRYRFQDQKQVSSWSTKDKLTSPVIYDPVGCQYAAVFNYNQLRMWTNNEDQLDKVKKYKFEEPIHCILPQSDGDPAIVLFRNGCVALLAAAVESRKEAISGPILQRDELITDYSVVANAGRKLVTFITRNAKDDPMLNVVPIVLGGPPSRHALRREDVDGVHLIGQTVVQKDDSCVLLTQWSDGQMFSFTFLPHVQEKFPGTAFHTVMAVNSKNPVEMVTLGSKHIVLFGSDPSEEGAMMVLMSLQFRLMQSRLHFKLYSKPPRLWSVGANLLVAVGNSLVVVPYQLQAERLSTLVGSHASYPPTVHTNWLNDSVKGMEVTTEVPPEEIREELNKLRSGSLSEAIISQKVIPLVIEKKQATALIWCLQNFTDISETCLAQALTFCLSEPDSTFLQVPSENPTSVEQNEDTMDTSTNEKDVEEKVLVPAGRGRLMDVILNVPVSEVCLVPPIRDVPFTLTLMLLRHLGELVQEDSTTPQVRVLQWICLLLDAHYQQFLLSRDPQVLALLCRLRDLVSEQLSYMEDLKKLAPVLNRLRTGKLPVKLQLGDRRYSVELLQLY